MEKILALKYIYCIFKLIESLFIHHIINIKKKNNKKNAFEKIELFRNINYQYML
jgi:hypothetical protein